VDCENQRSVLRVRASERYLVSEFGFNLNQWCIGVGTRGKGIPTPLFLALHPWLKIQWKYPWMQETPKNPISMTKITFTFKIFAKNPCMCISEVIFWQYSERIKKFFPRIPFRVFDPIFALRRRLKNPRTPCAQKKLVRADLWEKLGGKKCRLGRLSSTSRFGVLRTKCRG